MSPESGSSGFSCLCYLRFILGTVLYCLLIGIPRILIMPFIAHGNYRRQWRKLIRLYGRTILSLAAYPKVRIEYYDLAPEERAPGIVVANHRSGVDAFMFAWWPVELVQIAGDWPFRLPFFGVFARFGGYYNIRKITFEDFIRRGSEDILSDHVSVVGFPEGTRSPGREMGQFHGTLFRLAMETKSPVYPFLMLGTENIVDRRFVIRPGRVRLYKLPAVPPEQFAEWTPFHLKNHVRDLLAARMDELELNKNDEVV